MIDNTTYVRSATIYRPRERTPAPSPGPSWPRVIVVFMQLYTDAGVWQAPVMQTAFCMSQTGFAAGPPMGTWYNANGSDIYCYALSAALCSDSDFVTESFPAVDPPAGQGSGTLTPGDYPVAESIWFPYWH